MYTLLHCFEHCVLRCPPCRYDFVSISIENSTLDFVLGLSSYCNRFRFFGCTKIPAHICIYDEHMDINANLYWSMYIKHTVDMVLNGIFILNLYRWMRVWNIFHHFPKQSHRLSNQHFALCISGSFVFLTNLVRRSYALYLIWINWMISSN